MKNITVILVFSALIGWFYPVSSGVTYCDLLSVPLLIIAIAGAMFFNWRTDYYCRGTLTYCTIMFLSALVNETVFQTIFQNFFRIILESVIFYFCIRNCVRTEKGIRIFYFCCMLFICYFIYYSTDLLSQSFHVTQFYQLEFGYGQNNWGFTSLLISCLVCFFVQYHIDKSRLLLMLIPVMLSFIVFSASRMALIMFAITLIAFRFWIKQPFSAKEGIGIVVMTALSVFIILYMSTLASSSMIDFIFGFIAKKMDYVADDAVDNRLGFLNFGVITEFWEQRYLYENILGDGISIRHGLFAQIYTATGFIGFVQYLFYHIRTYFIWCRINRAAWAVWLLIIMFINDIVTNASFIIGINSMLFMIFCAFILQYAEIKNRVPSGNVKQLRRNDAKRSLSYQWPLKV